MVPDAEEVSYFWWALMDLLVSHGNFFQLARNRTVNRNQRSSNVIDPNEGIAGNSQFC